MIEIVIGSLALVVFTIGAAIAIAIIDTLRGKR
jgi:hypothetical protein